jgi:hypothetical protein
MHVYRSGTDLSPVVFTPASVDKETNYRRLAAISGEEMLEAAEADPDANP